MSVAASPSLAQSSTRMAAVTRDGVTPLTITLPEPTRPHAALI